MAFFSFPFAMLASALTLGASTLCIRVTGSGGATVTTIGPLVDLHGVSAPTVAISAWDASGAAQQVSIACGNVSTNAQCAWPQKSGTYQPLAFTAGGYVVFNDLGVDATRSTPAAPVTGQQQHDWKVSFTHSINKSQSFLVSGARRARVFQFLENAATLLLGKALFPK